MYGVTEPEIVENAGLPALGFDPAAVTCLCFTKESKADLPNVRCGWFADIHR